MIVTRISEITNYGIDYLHESKKETLLWIEFHTANAFKRDLLNYDLICLQLSKEDKNEGIELDEEDPKWNELINELPKRIDGFRDWKIWFSEVAHPAFKTNLVRIYER
ncbi:hypothetical protein [Pelagicoccus albus]|uniref:Uncharacterized protein n=1 Tax=Pelagicoccus albus TaxID=415222 RepID=A0A7X1B619_9BACT|nr:hypothetical protein [Pelagicoccus albus]MBC2606329.1 hypothetical protein [Pelagicoccus albus]